MSYSSVVLADSPLAYYRLGEPSGTTVTDATGNGHTGTYTNTPLLGQTGALVGDSDTAVSFTAASSQYALLDTLGTFGTNLLTCTTEFWIKTTTAATLVNPLGTVNTGTATFLAVYLNSVHSGTTTVVASAGKTSFFIRGQTSSANCIGDIAFNLYDGAWHHVVWVVNAANAFLVYVDGVSRTVTMNAQSSTAGANFGFGMLLGGQNARGTPSQFADCSLDEVAFYTSRLSAAQVAAHYAAGTSPTFNDSGSGAVTLSGTGSDSFTSSGTFTDSAVGTLSLSGARVEALVRSGSRSGGLILAGVGSDSWTHGLPPRIATAGTVSPRSLAGTVSPTAAILESSAFPSDVTFPSPTLFPGG